MAGSGSITEDVATQLRPAALRSRPAQRGRSGSALWAIGSRWDVIGTTDVSNRATYSLPTAYFWAVSNQVYIAGSNTPSHGGWVGFQAGDVCVFRLDGGRLRMRCSRLAPAVFEIPLQGAGPWHAHVNLNAASDEVALLPTAAEDTAGL